LGQGVQAVPVGAQQVERRRVALLDDAADLGVDELQGVRRRPVRRRQPNHARRGQDGDGAHGFAHPPAADHLAGDGGDLLEVGLGPGGDVLSAPMIRPRR
jgi:hypothetical protein